MKKLFLLLLTSLLLLALTAGCGQTGSKAQSVFTAENEIVSYDRIDPDKTQLIISRTGNIDIDGVCEAFVAANPDVQIIRIDITGGNNFVQPLRDWIANGYTPDIVFTGAQSFYDEDVSAYFENLSADPVLENYQADALQRVAVNANIYWLPGPSNISAMTYNKTLFDQYGWETPVTFDEFVALCEQIIKDTDGKIVPWNPNAKYSNELETVLQAFCYEEVFGGVENYKWYSDFLAGNASFTGHMEPYYEVNQILADKELLKEEFFSYSATTRGQEFIDGKIAMINGNIVGNSTSAYEFGYFPYPTTIGSMGYICDDFSCLVAIPLRERSEEQQAALTRFMEFFSSVEGQQAYIGASPKISNVKDAATAAPDSMAAVQAAVDKGHMFERIGFDGELGSHNFSFSQQALDITTGVKTGAECIAEVDAEPFKPAEESQPAEQEVLASAAEDMTILETSFYIADAYRQAAGADIALIANNTAFRGNLMRIFAGDITTAFVTVLKPRSFANDSTLVKVAMTGQQLLDALNAPPGYDEEPANCIYAYSGLQCELAPWNELGSKYLSVKLADGSELDPTAVYTVACWDGTIDPAFITETPEPVAGTWEEIMAAKLKADGAVTAADDGRYTLLWE